MKAVLLLENNQLFITKTGGTVEIRMDLYKLPKADPGPPGSGKGKPFKWTSIEQAIQLFREKVAEHFGELEAAPDDGG